MNREKKKEKNKTETPAGDRVKKCTCIVVESSHHFVGAKDLT